MGVNREGALKASRKEAPKQATFDENATVVESHKEQSRMTYLGKRGYQPVINYWVEQDLILSDEFRDGNVPAGMDCLTWFLRATRALPDSVETIYFRSDSAAYPHKLLDVMRDGIKLNGKQIPVYFGISADVSEALVVAAQLSLLQRDPGDEAQGFAEKLLAGADEGVEISSDWGSRQGSLARAHDVSQNHRRVDWLSRGEKPTGGVFQRLQKQI